MLPVLTSAEAVCASAFISAAFVGVLYALPAPIAALRRDDPRQIKARMAAICVATLFAAAVVAGLIVGREDGGGGGGGGGAGSRLVAWMGLRLLDATAASACARSLLLSATLFLGALCAEALELASLRTHWLARDGSLRPRASGPLPWAELARTFQAYALVAPPPPPPPAKADGQPAAPAAAAAAATAAAAVEARRWSALRNLVAAPLAEELTFRAAVCPLLLAAGWAASRVALVAPLFFGIAHVHHGVVAWRSGAASARGAAAQVAVQTAYTTAFGMFAAFVFVRTGRVAPAVASHAFCNYMGLPHMGFLWADHHLHRHRRALLVAYAAGIGAFCCGLYPLTEGFGPLPWDNASAVR